jgi:hypothetical protein
MVGEALLMVPIRLEVLVEPADEVFVEHSHVAAGPLALFPEVVLGGEPLEVVLRGEPLEVVLPPVPIIRETTSRVRLV